MKLPLSTMNESKSMRWLCTKCSHKGTAYSLWQRPTCIMWFNIRTELFHLNLKFIVYNVSCFTERRTSGMIEIVFEWKWRNGRTRGEKNTNSLRYITKGNLPVILVAASEPLHCKYIIPRTYLRPGKPLLFIFARRVIYYVCSSSSITTNAHWVLNPF